MGALTGLKVLDLSRVLAGPTCTQLLGDLGAEVVKIENPETGGDDTRAWGPPHARGPDGAPTDLSAYFMAANRNKLSVAADLGSDAGRALVRALAARADVVVENFKPGGLGRFGLDAETLLAAHPGLVYCSISGFGQTGPNRDKPGYDLMAQGHGGIMSLTGDPQGEPMKVGVGIADVMCGMYACVGILAALRHRDRTGAGQHVELGLVDTQVAWLVNEGVGCLMTGRAPERRGNGHSSIVPYQVFAARDGHVIVAVGNDSQFERFCAVLDAPHLPRDPRFATNPARVEHRAALIALLEPLLAARPAAGIVAELEAAKVPVGPVQTLDRVFASDQVAARGMKIDMARDDVAGGAVSLIGNPLKFSATPVTYRHAPPRFGQDTETVKKRLESDG